MAAFDLHLPFELAGDQPVRHRTQNPPLLYPADELLATDPQILGAFEQLRDTIESYQRCLDCIGAALKCQQRPNRRIIVKT